jgi:hypothetical protein
MNRYQQFQFSNRTRDGSRELVIPDIKREEACPVANDIGHRAGEAVLVQSQILELGKSGRK